MWNPGRSPQAWPGSRCVLGTPVCVEWASGQEPGTHLSLFESEEKIFCCGSGSLLSSIAQGVKQEDGPETGLKNETLLGAGAQSCADKVPITQLWNKGERPPSQLCSCPTPQSPSPRGELLRSESKCPCFWRALPSPQQHSSAALLHNSGLTSRCSPGPRLPAKSWGRERVEIPLPPHWGLHTTASCVPDL